MAYGKKSSYAVTSCGLGDKEEKETKQY